MIDTATGEVIFEPNSSVGSIIRERVRQINILRLARQIGGCASTLSARLGGRQDDRPTHATVGLLQESDRIPVPGQVYDYHFVLHWLHEHLPRYVMAAYTARVAPEHPELIWKKYETKFAGDVQSRRVLYGLQAGGLAAPALGSDSRTLVTTRKIIQEVLDASAYRD